MMRPILAALAAILLAGCAGSELTMTSAVGEFENDADTHQTRLEYRAPAMEVAGVDAYVAARAEHNDHPRPEVKDQLMAGGGLHIGDWRGELVANDDRYLASLTYLAPTEVWEIRGGVVHGNKWGAGFKQTGLQVSVGYPLTERVSLGAFYDIKNTTMRSVDDLYGGYLSVRF